MPKQTILTKETVTAAVQAIQSDGLRPTFQRIIERCGGGGFSTLTNLRREYPEIFGLGMAIEQTEGTRELFDLKLEVMQLKHEKEIDRIEQESTTRNQELEQKLAKVSIDFDRERECKEQAEQREREAIGRIKELESELAMAHKKQYAGTISKTESDTPQMAIENLGTQEKSAKARAIELHEQFPNMTQREIIERLFDEGFKTRSGKRLGSGQISKWLNSGA